MQEFDLINKYFKNLTKISSDPKIKYSSLDLKDDIAIINLNKTHDLIVSKDIFIENVHFLKEDGAKKISSKLLLTNLSDIASSGGSPLFYMLGFTKNSNCDEQFIKEFCQGLKKIQKEFDINLIGGDTSNSEKLAFSITIFGLVKKNKILQRNSAKAGDLIFVSNYIGDALLGLNIKNNLPKKILNYHQKLLDKHFFPKPRIDLAKKLIEENLSCCSTDISDGLLKDLSNICNASNLDAHIYLSKIPVSPWAKKYLNENSNFSIQDLICGGDDYELIFSINPKNLAKISNLSKKLKLKLTHIGEFYKPESTLKSPNKKFDVFLFKNFHNSSSNKFDHKNILKITKLGYEHQ